MDENEMDEIEQCGTCGGQLFELGMLGRVRWMQCRNCGLNHMEHATDDGVTVYQGEQVKPAREAPEL